MRRQFSETGKSGPGLGTQAHFRCGLLAPGQSRLEPTSAGGPSARRRAGGAQERPVRGQKMALWFRGRGGRPDTICEGRGPGPTRSPWGEGHPHVAESGCGGDSPLPLAPGRIGEAGPRGTGTPQGLQAAPRSPSASRSLPLSPSASPPAGRAQPTALPRYTSCQPAPNLRILNIAKLSLKNGLLASQ